MADTTFALDEIPGVTFTASFGSGGESGLPSNWIQIVGTVPNPHYDPDYDYATDPQYNYLTDPWKRHNETVVVHSGGFVGPVNVLPTDPPPAPTPPAEAEPEPQPSPEE